MFGFSVWTIDDYLLRPISVIAWGALLEVLWRIAGALESKIFVASETSLRTQLAWRSRVARALVFVAVGYYLVSAVLFMGVMSKLPAYGDFALTWAATISTWVQEPLRFIAVGGCIEYLLRIGKALPEGAVLTHDRVA